MAAKLATFDGGSGGITDGSAPVRDRLDQVEAALPLVAHPDGEGEIIVKDYGVRVEVAPQRSMISLSLLTKADPRWLRVVGTCEVVIGSELYEVTAWDRDAGCLTIERRS